MLCSLKRHLLVGVFLISFSGAVSVSAQVVLPVQNPDNGHFYEAVTVPGGISWVAAYAVTQTRTYAGIRGHLATITSAEENQFLVNHFPQALTGRYWLGGFQPDGILQPALGWQWVTGEPWGYTNWGTGEPNDAWPTGEDRLQIHLNGFWNDEPRHFLVGGYLIEYEAAPTHADLYVAAINDVPTPGRPDQVTISVGDCVTLTYRVRFRVGPFVDVTQSESTSFFTSPARGTFVSGNVWCPTEADRNKFITLYARHFSPLTGIGIGDTVIVHVRR